MPLLVEIEAEVTRCQMGSDALCARNAIKFLAAQAKISELDA
jgi:hypothetical protein